MHVIQRESMMLEFQKRQQGSCCHSFFYCSTRRRGSQTSWCCWQTTSASTTFPGTMWRCTRPRCRSLLMRASSSTREWSLQKKTVCLQYIPVPHQEAQHSLPPRYYTQPRCSPSRAALLTGLYPYRTGTQRGNIRQAAERFLKFDTWKVLAKKASSRHLWKDLNFKMCLQSISTVWPRHHIPSFAGYAQGGRLFNSSGLEMIIVNQNTAPFLYVEQFSDFSLKDWKVAPRLLPPWLLAHEARLRHFFWSFSNILFPTFFIFSLHFSNLFLCFSLIF